MKDLETMQREGREGFKQDFTSDCEGYIDCIKGQLDKLDQHTASTWKAAQKSMIKDVHKKFPVPDMEHAEMWPHDEQIRWAGIGEVISYLNSKV